LYPSLFRYKSDILTIETIESASLSLYRKKLYFRSIHRGTKEMDKLLGEFATKYLLKFTFNQLSVYEQFLELSDDVLYRGFLDQEKFPTLVTEEIGEFLQEFRCGFKLS